MCILKSLHDYPNIIPILSQYYPILSLYYKLRRIIILNLYVIIIQIYYIQAIINRVYNYVKLYRYFMIRETI